MTTGNVSGCLRPWNPLLAKRLSACKQKSYKSHGDDTLPHCVISDSFLGKFSHFFPSVAWRREVKPGRKTCCRCSWRLSDLAPLPVWSPRTVTTNISSAGLSTSGLTWSGLIRGAKIIFPEMKTEGANSTSCFWLEWKPSEGQFSTSGNMPAHFRVELWLWRNVLCSRRATASCWALRPWRGKQLAGICSNL